MVRDPGNTLRKATNLNLSGGKTVFKDTIGGKDKNDFFRFRLSGRSSVQAILNGLKSNADLTILNRSGDRLAQSRNSGKKAEAIQQTLEGGQDYYIRIRSNGRRTSYRLAISANPAPRDSVVLPGVEDKNKIDPIDPIEPTDPQQTTPPPPGNTAPTLNATGTTTARNRDLRLSGGLLRASDTEQNAGQLRYTLNGAPQNGTLFLNGVPLGAGGSFTQADIDNGGLSYRSLPGARASSIGDAFSIVNSPTGESTVFAVNGNNIFWEDLSGNLRHYNLLRDNAANTTVTNGGNLLSSSGDFVGKSGSNVVYQDALGELFFYSGSGEPINITNTIGQGFDPAQFSSYQFEGMDGSNVVFSATDLADSAFDRELFVFNGSQVIRATRNTADEQFGGISGSKLTYSVNLTGQSDIYLADVSNPTAATNLTANFNSDATFDFDNSVSNFPFIPTNSGDRPLDLTRTPAISGSNVAFMADGNLHYSNGNAASAPVQLTSDPNSWFFFYGISGNTVTWDARDLSTAQNRQIYAASVTNGVANMVSTATSSTPNLSNNENIFQGISGTRVVWSGIDENGNSKLFMRDGVGAIVKLNSERADDDFEAMDGSSVVWRTEVGGQSQLFYSNVTSSSTLVRLTQTAATGFNFFGGLSGTNVLYQETNGQMFLRNLATGQAAVPIPASSFADVDPVGVFGANAVWIDRGTGSALFFGNFAPSDAFSFTVADGAGGSIAGSYTINLSNS